MKGYPQLKNSTNALWIAELPLIIKKLHEILHVMVTTLQNCQQYRTGIHYLIRRGWVDQIPGKEGEIYVCPF